MSFAALALWVVGAGVAGLALTALAVAVLPVPPNWLALVVLVGIVLTIAAMGVASNRMTARAIRAEYWDDDEAEREKQGERPRGDADRASDTDERRGHADGLG